ncbi:MAG: FecR domain-containing protein [Planctomycetota bacterium]|jgi:ferric-dicitrate binding protein FerR (iron transport regulator)
MNCEECKNVIEEYLDGTISDEQSAELKIHAEKCESCRADLGRCELMQDAIKEAFSSSTAAVQAKASLVARLSAEPNRLVSARHTGAWLAGRQAAVAAGIVLGVGLFLGFALGRAGIGKTVRRPVTAQVPIRVGQLEGTVLVRHQGSEVWQTLEVGSNVYLGDTFHSAAQSACALELNDESTLELNQNSMLVLKLYNGQTQFFLEHGECTASLESPHGPFFISTPHGRVEALGTEFTVTVIDE